MNRRFRSLLALPITAFLVVGPMPDEAAALGRPGVLEGLLAAEFARVAGDPGVAAAHALAATRASSDASLAEAAVATALEASDAPRAAAALARWQMLEPSSARRDAFALRFHVAQGEDDLATAVALRLLGGAGGLAAVVAGLEAPYADRGVIARAVLRGLLREPAFPSRVEAWLAMAGLAQRLEDPVLSAQWVDALVLRFPDDPRAGLLQADRLARSGEREAARAEVRRVLDRSDLPTEQRRIGAEALAVLGDAEGAAAAMARGAQDARSLTLRATWLARAGDIEGLRLLFMEGEALAADPRRVPADPALPLLLGELAERVQDWPSAERWYRRLDRGEARDRARLRLGVVLHRQGRLDEAVAMLRALQDDEAVDGGVRRDAYIAEADQWESRRRPRDAEAALTRGLAVLEDDPTLRIARAGVARNARRFASAEADLRAVLARDGRHAPALLALGALLLDRGRPGDAEPLLSRAWSIDPGAPTAAAWGESLWLLGRTAEARSAWGQGERLDPGDPVLVDTRGRYGQ